MFMKKLTVMKHIPNVLTLTNMMLGLAAILFLLQVNHSHKSFMVTGFIILGGIADFFDGFLARKLNSATDIGKQLDSFADLITFGIAPVSLVNYLGYWGHSALVILSSLLFVSAGAYRLARYNLGNFSNYFMGLPIPIAGILLAAYSVVVVPWLSNEYPHWASLITAVVLILLALLMVSTKKMVRRI